MVLEIMYLKEIQGMCCPLCCGVCCMVTQQVCVNVVSSICLPVTIDTQSRDVPIVCCGAWASFLYLLNNVGLSAGYVASSIFVPVGNGYTWHQHCSSQGGTASFHRHSMPR